MSWDDVCRSHGPADALSAGGPNIMDSRRLQGLANCEMPSLNLYLSLPKPACLKGPFKFHSRVCNKNLQYNKVGYGSRRKACNYWVANSRV